jgi:hypothetical protein
MSQLQQASFGDSCAVVPTTAQTVHRSPLQQPKHWSGWFRAILLLSRATGTSV